MNKNIAINLLKKMPTDASIFYGFFDSPFGTALIFIYEKNIISLAFCDNKNKTFAEMKQRFTNNKYILNTKLINQYGKKIFANNNKNKLSLAIVGTEFQLAVWRALLVIPFGTTTTYSAIAKKIKKPNAVRATATAIGKNPIAFTIPCHRIIGKNGNLCGYHWGIKRKQKILEYEKAI